MGLLLCLGSVGLSLQWFQGGGGEILVPPYSQHLRLVPPSPYPSYTTDCCRVFLVFLTVVCEGMTW